MTGIPDGTTTDPLSGLPVNPEDLTPPDEGKPRDNTVYGENTGEVLPDNAQIGQRVDERNELQTEPAPEETQTEETQAEDTKEPTGEPGWWWPGKYRTPEDARKSLQEQEELIGRQSDELGDLRRFKDDVQRAGLTPQAQAPAQPGQQPIPQVDPQSVQAIAQTLIDQGVMSEEAAWQTAYAQVQATNAQIAAGVKPLVDQLQRFIVSQAAASYDTTASQAVQSVGVGEQVEAAEVAATLRESVPPEQWANLSPDQQRHTAEMAVKVALGDKVLKGAANPKSPEPPPATPAPRVNVPTQATSEAPNPEVEAQVQVLRRHPATAGLTEEQLRRAVIGGMKDQRRADQRAAEEA